MSKELLVSQACPFDRRLVALRLRVDCCSFFVRFPRCLRFFARFLGTGGGFVVGISSSPVLLPFLIPQIHESQYGGEEQRAAIWGLADRLTAIGSKLGRATGSPWRLSAASRGPSVHGIGE